MTVQSDDAPAPRVLLLQVSGERVSAPLPTVTWPPVAVTVMSCPEGEDPIGPAMPIAAEVALAESVTLRVATTPV